MTQTDDGSRNAPAALEPGRSRIGWIGTGVMGSPLCGHLLRAGYALQVTTRTRERAQPLLDEGARWTATPREAAADCDAVFTMVGFPEDVRAVVFGEEGVLAGLRAGAVLVDATTSRPSLAEEIARAARERGAWAVDAPVSGGDVGAREGRLSIMVGGEVRAVEAVRPVLEVFGSSVVHQGGPGSGQHTKMVNQTLIASNMVGVCEALLYARRAGLDPETVLRSVSTGAAGSWSLSNLAPRILDGDFAPGFYVEHFLKDMAIALDEAARMDLALPGLALAQQLYRAVRAQGHGRSGTQALQLALADLSRTPWPERR